MRAWVDMLGWPAGVFSGWELGFGLWLNGSRLGRRGSGDLILVGEGLGGPLFGLRWEKRQC